MQWKYCHRMLKINQTNWTISILFICKCKIWYLASKKATFLLSLDLMPKICSVFQFLNTMVSTNYRKPTERFSYLILEENVKSETERHDKEKENNGKL